MQEDRQDLDLLRGALEALLACFAVAEHSMPAAGQAVGEVGVRQPLHCSITLTSYVQTDG